ncbi:hypothetical protein EVAR_89443_1 [Eumeta japonica]|uniref:Uncharacterized protein n=1 Tax=Eumeta variegata TaxID=151549 RepID=A0A4C1Z4V0_EUMVA|nr:hypothetical protein EVAR_89443_1 [Eumeta japonica]
MSVKRERRVNIGSMRKSAVTAHPSGKQEIAHHAHFADVIHWDHDDVTAFPVREAIGLALRCHIPAQCQRANAMIHGGFMAS